MKKIKKSFPDLQKSKIGFDQLSQIKGGFGPHDLFSDGTSKGYDPHFPT